MALNTCKIWFNGVKAAFFSKNYENRPAAGGFAPDPHSLRRLGAQPPDPRQWYISNTVHFFTQHVFQFRHFYILTIGLSPPSLNEIPVTCQHQATASDLPFCNIFAPTKTSLSKFLMTSLHVICGSAPLPRIKILATPMAEPLSKMLNYEKIVQIKEFIVWDVLLVICMLFDRGGVLEDTFWSPWPWPWPWPRSLKSLALASKSQVLGLGLGLEASSPRKLPCPRLEDSTIFWTVEISLESDRNLAENLRTPFLFSSIGA